MEYFVISDKAKRENNEDSYIYYIDDINDKFLFMVADGLGGHSLGEEASKLACKVALDMFKNYDKLDYKEYFDNYFKEIQKQIYEKQKILKSDMKTTVCMLVGNSKEIMYAHIGDSRIYHFSKNKIIKRTLDHSLVQLLVKNGEIKEKDIRTSEDKNILLRTIGMENMSDKSYDFSESIKNNKEDIFLLCSDGFWELILEKDMEKLLHKSNSLKEWLLSMEKHILQKGKDKNMDNYTILICCLGEYKRHKKFFERFW